MGVDSSEALVQLLSPDGYYTYLGIEKAAASTAAPSTSEGENSPFQSAVSAIDEEAVKKNYRKLSLKHHPDKPGGDADTFRVLNRAQKVLSNAKLRQQYDILGIDLDDDEEEHNDDGNASHEDGTGGGGGGGAGNDSSTAQGIVHEIASTVLTSIIQLGVRTLMMGAVACLLVRFWWLLYPALCFLGFIGFRIFQTSRIPGAAGSVYDVLSPMMIAAGLLLMHHGRRFVEVDSDTTTWEWTVRFWLGEAIVIGMFTFNSLPILPKNGIVLGGIAVFSLITALWFRGKVWNYVIVLGLIALIGVFVALAFPIMELVLEAVLNEKLKKVGEKVRHHHKVLQQHYERKLKK